jgi:hypothetical protein
LAVVVEDCHGLVVGPGVEDAVVVVLLELVDYGEQPVDQNRPEAGRKRSVSRSEYKHKIYHVRVDTRRVRERGGLRVIGRCAMREAGNSFRRIPFPPLSNPGAWLWCDLISCPLWSEKAREEGQKGGSIPDGDRHILLVHHVGELGKVRADAIAVVLLPRDCALRILFDGHLNNVGPRTPCPHGKALPRLVIAGEVAPAAAGE